jgi:hypothetical protein
MKKVYLSFLFLSLILGLHAQAWKVYEARYLPLVNVPPFTSSSPTGATYQLIVNPENPNDSIYKFVSFPDVAIGQLWKYTYPEANVNGLTLVTRVKGFSTEPTRIIEFDLDNFGWRERVYILPDNTYKMEFSKATGVLPGSSLDWHIYRMTKLDDTVRLYVDENPEPISVAKIPIASTIRNYFRFGDGSGSITYGGMVDWITWDVTGAYAPGQGAALPDTLVKTVPKLNVYNANQLPNEFSASFTTSNVGGDAPGMTIIDDPDNAGNKLFEYIIGGVSSKHMWKYTYSNPAQPIITLIARVKANSAQYDRAIELDMENGGWRDRLFVKNPNLFELKESATTGELPVGTLGWHIYRLTKDADSVKFYLDENPIPFRVVKTNSVSANNYFRFGDGNSSSSVGGLIDWVVWDETGAYAPGRGNFLPDSLVTSVSSSDASLATMEASAGTLVPAFDKTVMSYDLVLPLGSTTVSFTATATDAKANILGIGEFTALPGTATITVTSEDGLISNYIINVTVATALNDASLQSLTVSVGTLDPAFDKAVLTYNLVLPEGSVIVTLTAASTDALATVTGDGDFTAIPGVATITVTAQDGTQVVYTVNVSAVLSANAQLASLEVSAGTLDPIFDPFVTAYTLVLPVGTTTVNLTATSDNINATVTGDGSISVPGTATITVTAENGVSTTDYVVTITISTVGVNQSNSKFVSIYPNPAGNMVTITAEPGSRICILNSLGKNLAEIVTESSSGSIDLSRFEPGLYFLRIQNHNGTEVKKLIKK